MNTAKSIVLTLYLVIVLVPLQLSERTRPWAQKQIERLKGAED